MGVAAEFSTLAEMFERVSDRFASGDRPALLVKSDGIYRGISYPELRARVGRVSAGLSALGVRSGDRVAILSENRPEWIIADMAMMKLGAVNVAIFPTLAPAQAEYIINDSGAQIVIVSGPYQLGKILSVAGRIPGVRSIVVMSGQTNESGDPRIIPWSVLEVPGTGTVGSGSWTEGGRRPEPGDLMALVYTSGTTGNPRGVMLTHENLVCNIRASASCIPFGIGDVILSFLPLSHSYERMAGYYTAFACGVTIAFAESLERLRENLIEVRPTVVTAVPRFFERFHARLEKQVGLQSPMRQRIFRWAVDTGKQYAGKRREGRPGARLRLRHWIAERAVLRKIVESMGGRMRFMVSGGAALSRELAEFFEAAGILIIEGYGMTETSPVISVNRPDEYRFGTVGKPIPGIEVSVGADGEILVRGKSVTRGYWRDEQATRDLIDAGGWLHTGDVGRFDADGFLVITDRKKHIFVTSGGKNVAPQPIEHLFLQSPYIDQFMLIGDARQFLSALIVPEFERVRQHLRARSVICPTDAELVRNPGALDLFEKEIARIQKELPSHERVRRFTLLGEPLAIERGEMTPTLKVRRRIVEERYRDLIEKMYDGLT